MNMCFIKCGKELINIDEINSVYEENVENDEPYCVIATKNGTKHVLDGVKIGDVCDILYNNYATIYEIKKSNNDKNDVIKTKNDIDNKGVIIK